MINQGTKLEVLPSGLLTDESRATVARKVLFCLQKKEEFRSLRLTLEEIILHQASALADYLRGDATQYRPYIHKW
jgi:hypothetical protein